jgi:GTP-binding protein
VLRPLRSRDDVVVGRAADGAYTVSSARVERWVSMLPTDNPEAMRYLAGRMRRAGVERKLVRAGARAGDDVVIGDLVMTFTPDPRDLPEEEREAMLAAELAADLAEDGEELDDVDDWDDDWAEDGA